MFEDGIDILLVFRGQHIREGLPLERTDRERWHTIAAAPFPVRFSQGPIHELLEMIDADADGNVVDHFEHILAWNDK